MPRQDDAFDGALRTEAHAVLDRILDAESSQALLQHRTQLRFLLEAHASRHAIQQENPSPGSFAGIGGGNNDALGRILEALQRLTPPRLPAPIPAPEIVVEPHEVESHGN